MKLCKTLRYVSNFKRTFYFSFQAESIHNKNTEAKRAT